MELYAEASEGKRPPSPHPEGGAGGHSERYPRGPALGLPGRSRRPSRHSSLARNILRALHVGQYSTDSAQPKSVSPVDRPTLTSSGPGTIVHRPCSSPLDGGNEHEARIVCCDSRVVRCRLHRPRRHRRSSGLHRCDWHPGVRRRDGFPGPGRHDRCSGPARHDGRPGSGWRDGRTGPAGCGGCCESGACGYEPGPR